MLDHSQISDETAPPPTLPQSFFNRSTIEVAQDLLGKIIVHEFDGIRLSGRIVETEAYCGTLDAASHAACGKTERNAAMFGPTGHAYVYLSYGIHYCLNIVSRAPDSVAGGVLIRAIEPLEGIEHMLKHRRVKMLRDVANGPGKVGDALHITRDLNGTNLMEPQGLYLLNAPKINDIVATPRIGISKNKEPLLRFHIKNSPWISR